MDISKHRFFQIKDFFFCGWMPRRGIAGSLGRSSPILGVDLYVLCIGVKLDDILICSNMMELEDTILSEVS